jgi:hypothetical protein
MSKTEKILTVDITPPFHATVEALETLKAQAIGRDLDHQGQKGKILSARIANGRLLAEVKFSGNLILG